MQPLLILHEMIYASAECKLAVARRRRAISARGPMRASQCVCMCAHASRTHKNKMREVRLHAHKDSNRRRVGPHLRRHTHTHCVHAICVLHARTHAHTRPVASMSRRRARAIQIYAHDDTNCSHRCMRAIKRADDHDDAHDDGDDGASTSETTITQQCRARRRQSSSS